MILTADNLVARLEKVRGELSKQLGKAPNRIRMNARTYSKFCDDAQTFFHQPTKQHVTSLFGAMVMLVAVAEAADGVVLFDYHQDLPKA